MDLKKHFFIDEHPYYQVKIKCSLRQCEINFFLFSYGECKNVAFSLHKKKILSEKVLGLTFG